MSLLFVGWLVIFIAICAVVYPIKWAITIVRTIREKNADAALARLQEKQR